MASSLLHLATLRQFLNRGTSRIDEKPSEAIRRPAAGAVALASQRSLDEHDPLRKLLAELASLVVAKERHRRLAEGGGPTVRRVDDAIRHFDPDTPRPDVTFDHHHVHWVARTAKPVSLERKQMGHVPIRAGLIEHGIERRPLLLAAANGVVKKEVAVRNHAVSLHVLDICNGCPKRHADTPSPFDGPLQLGC